MESGHPAECRNDERRAQYSNVSHQFSLHAVLSGTVLPRVGRLTCESQPNRATAVPYAPHELGGTPLRDVRMSILSH
jgi:hypothetical protein